MKDLFKQLYKIIPFKKQLFILIKNVFHPHENIYKHLYFIGWFTLNVNNNKSFKINHFGYQLENEMFWEGLYGRYEKETLILWTKLCENSDVILDVGANTGIFSLIAKTVNPKSTVYAFEPIQRVYNKLEGNIKLNNFDVQSFPIALSDANGEIKVFDNTNVHEYTVSLDRNRFSSTTNAVEVIINRLRLENFIQKHEISKIDLIKIDVEYHEFEVLVGMGKYIQSFKPSIILECVEEELGKKIQNLIKDCGYLYFNIDENKGAFQVNEILKSNHFNYLICTQEVAKSLSL